MTFSHCDQNETHLSLHDCIAEKAYFENGKLGFEFPDGFWICSDHPENNLSETVRTDFSKAEFTLENREADDVTVYVFQKNIFQKTVRTEWTVQQLVDQINSGKYRLEFLYQYLAYNSRMVECWLHFDKKPYMKECLISINASDVHYYWNHLCGDRVW